MDAMTFPDWPTELEWIRSRMPVMITFNVSSRSDDWLRRYLEGDPAEATPTLQGVIVQGTREAERLVAGLARAKRRKGLPYGGALQRANR